jgi:iron(III) transport system permease protein
MSRTTARFVFALTSAFFAVFFLWPILQILKGGFTDENGRPTLAFLEALLSDPTYLGALMNSFLLACAGTAMAFLIALPLAAVSDRFLFPFKGFLNSAVLIPMILPPFVGAIGIKQIFGQYGSVNTLLIDLGLRPRGWTFDWFAANQFWGVAVVEALSLYPIIYLNAVAALANVDPAMEEAAQNLGCTGLRRFRRITLPLIHPGLFAGGTIVFIWVFTELGTPLVFDYSKVTSVQIYYGLKDIGGNPFPYTLVAVMLASSVAIYAVGKGVFGRTGHAMMAKATATGGARALPRPQAWLCTLLFCAVTLVAILPHLGVVLIASSKDWYASVLPRGPTLGNYRAALGHELTVPGDRKQPEVRERLDRDRRDPRGRDRLRRRPDEDEAGRHVLDFLHASARGSRDRPGVRLPRDVPGGPVLPASSARSGTRRVLLDDRLLAPAAAVCRALRRPPASSRRA